MRIKKIKDWLQQDIQFNFIETGNSVTRIKDGKKFSKHDLDSNIRDRTYRPYKIDTVDIPELKKTVHVVGWITHFDSDQINIDLCEEAFIIINDMVVIEVIVSSSSTIEINEFEEQAERFKELTMEFIHKHLEELNSIKIIQFDLYYDNLINDTPKQIDLCLRAGCSEAAQKNYRLCSKHLREAHSQGFDDSDK